MHGGDVGFGELVSFFEVDSLGGENLGPAVGESSGGLVGVLGGGPISLDDSKVDGFAVEGGPKPEKPPELSGTASLGR